MSVAPISAHKDILYLPVEIIQANTYQPRKIFEESGLMELAESIRQYGVLQPITVRLTKGYFYELVAGERRLRAAKIAGLLTIPAMVMDVTDKDSAVIAMIENLQRKDLNYIEEAEGYIRLMDDYRFTQEMLAKRIGKSQSAIANKIRILKLPETVRNILTAYQLSERHARALLKLTDEKQQVYVAEKVAENRLTVIKTEGLIDEILAAGHKAPCSSLGKKKKQKAGNVRFKVKDIRIFANTLKQNVAIMKDSGFQVAYHVHEQDGCYEFTIQLCEKGGE